MKSTMRSIITICCLTCLCGCLVEHTPTEDAGNDACPIDDQEDADSDAGTCEIPTGEYAGVLRYTGGDCTWGEDLNGTLGSMLVGVGVSCGETAWSMTLWQEEGCAYATLYRAEGDVAGLLQSSRVTMSASCEDGSGCASTYTIDLAPVSEQD